MVPGILKLSVQVCTRGLELSRPELWLEKILGRGSCHASCGVHRLADFQSLSTEEHDNSDDDRGNDQKA